MKKLQKTSEYSSVNVCVNPVFSILVDVHTQFISEYTYKHTQLKVSAMVFVLNRGSSLKLHSLLTPSGPVHP